MEGKKQGEELFLCVFCMYQRTLKYRDINAKVVVLRFVIFGQFFNRVEVTKGYCSSTHQDWALLQQYLELDGSFDVVWYSCVEQRS